MKLRDTLRKAASLLVELPPETASGIEISDEALSAAREEYESAAPAKTIEQILRESEGPDLDQITVPTSAGPPPANPDGSLDFAGIYRQAKLPPTPFTAEQMLEMLGSLPHELPLETKRLTVRVTLTSLGKSIGATPETLVADATRKLAALAAYAESLAKQTSDEVSTAEQEILALQSQVEERRTAIQSAKMRLAEVNRACDAESDHLDDVLEFFSLDVAPSKYAPGTP